MQCGARYNTQADEIVLRVVNDGDVRRVGILNIRSILYTRSDQSAGEARSATVAKGGEDTFRDSQRRLVARS